MSTAESNRQDLLKQMKVRTKFKKDKSWIQQQTSEDERDEIPSPISPQLKSLEGRKFIWSPTPDSKPERNSGTFTAKEVVISSSSPTVQTSNTQFSYTSTETNRSPPTTSQPSPPPSTTGGRTNPSYIIRGQPFNAVSQVKNPSNFNGHQKSYITVQPRTSNSLPRVPSATGHKMSTEEYKKLAPYNVRNRSTDLSDDEAPTMQQEQITRAEQASSVLRNTSPRDRSYVISAAKRNSGIGTHDTPSPFVAQRVQIQEEETSPNKKSQTLPKTLSSYLNDDHKRAENHWTETHSRPPTTQTTPSGVRDRSSSPILTSYSTSNIVETKKSTIKPEPAKITIVRQESNPTEDITKPAITTTARKERVETTKKSDAHPENLAYYLYNDVNRFEKNWTSNPPTQATSQTVTTRVETTKKNDAHPENLASYLYNDVNRFEKSQKSNVPTQSTSQTVTNRVTDRPESPKLVSWSSTSESRTSAVKPGPGKITVLHGESESSDPSISRLTSSTTERSSSNIQPGPGKIRVLIEDCNDGPDTLKLTFSSLSTRATENTQPNIQAGPGKITLIREEGDDTNKESPKPSVERRSTTRTTERVETTKKNDAHPENLASYLYDDVNRFEKSQKSNVPTQSTSQTVTNRVTDRPESPKLVSWSSTSESRTSAVKPGPGKITVLHGESETSDPSISRLTSSTTERSSSNIQPGPGKIKVLIEDCNDGPDTLKLTFSSLSTRATENTQPNIQAGPGKITLIRDEGDDTNKESPKPSVERRSTTRTTESNDGPDTLKLTSSSLSTRATENTQPNIQAGPGKISLIRDEGDIGNNRATSRTNETTYSTTSAKVTIETINESSSPKPAPRIEVKPKEAAAAATSDPQQDLISWSDLDSRVAKERSITPTPVPRQTNKDSEKSAGEPPLLIISPELNSTRTNQPPKPAVITTVDETEVNDTRYRVSESLDESNDPSPSGNKRVTVTISDTEPERPRTQEQRSSSPRPTPRPRETTNTTVTESRYRVPETIETTMLEASPSRSNSRTTVTTTRSTDPVYTEYMEDSDKRSTRTVSSSREKITTTTTETRYENSLSSEASLNEPQSPGNKGVLFVKEYVNSSESLKSPTTSGNIPDFSNDFDRVSYSSSSSYLYSSAPQRSEEGSCTYCGREIKDCPKIILEHLNIHCHEYCFKCGICHKPMGDLVDSLFIHRDVVHCESCYEKLF